MSPLRKGSSAPKTHPDALVKMSVVGTGSSIDADSVVLNCEIGRNCDIEKRNLLRKTTIGDMTYTGADTSITWASVGKWCCIARMVDIGGNEHNYHAASMMPEYRVMNRLAGKLRKHQDEAIVAVGNDVWIGSGATIVRKEGMTIGDGAVIGAGAVVTRSVKPYAIVAGVPARIIGWRFSEKIIEDLLALQWWNWPDELILQNWALLGSDLDESGLAKLKLAWDRWQREAQS